MKKGLIIMGILVNLLCASNTIYIDEGIYRAKDCDVSIFISSYGKNKHSYEFLGLEKRYRGDLIYKHDSVLFDKLYVDAKVKRKNYFLFHNILFEKCDKRLEYHKVDDLKVIEKDIKNKKNLDRYTFPFFYSLQELFPINEKYVGIYNNIAYDLYQAKKFEASVSLLRNILQLYPDRMVAYLNMGDALLAMNKKDEAKPYYLSYMLQMLKLGNEKKIPKDLWLTYSDELNIIRTLNRTIKENYQILDIAQGEINNDHFKDCVVVISYVDRGKIEYQQFGKPSNTNKRLLLVLLGGKDSFTVYTQTNHAIYPDDVPNCDDSFNGIKIKNKSLYIAYRYWCSAGGWSQGEETYQFLYRDNKMVLAGLESWNNSRASGEGKEVSANFLTKKLSIQKTVDFDKPQGKVVWKSIHSKGLIGLDEFSAEKVQNLLY